MIHVCILYSMSDDEQARLLNFGVLILADSEISSAWSSWLGVVA